MMNHGYLTSTHIYCNIHIYGMPCGTQDGVDHLFLTHELQSRKRYIDHVRISDYDLIKSRYSLFYNGTAICSRHRYLLCEGYVPNRCCVKCRTTNIAELIQMSVKASLFVKDVPIHGYICSQDRLYYEKQMSKENLQSIILLENGSSLKWDYYHKTPLVAGTGAMLETSTFLTQNLPVNVNDTENTSKSVAVVNQPKHMDDPFSCKSENETSRSTAPSSNLPNSSSAENNIKQKKLQLTLRTQQEGSLGQKPHSNQQYPQPDVSVLQNDVHVTQETETKKDTQKKKLTIKSSSASVSPTEPMEVQKTIQIKICASHSTSDACKTIDMLDTDTLAMLKAKITQILKFDNCSGKFSLSYVTSNATNACWNTLEIEKEHRTLSEFMRGHDYVVTCVPEKSVSAVYPLPGLQSLGNTCFMNSALQCLNHVEPFFNYFRVAKTKARLNGENNENGTTSRLALSYSHLVESLSLPNDGPVVPLEFHMEFGRLAPHFRNHHQHDSCEFLNVLLDILHEDLMRIFQKTYSIVSSIFHGQIRTVVTCQVCNRDLPTDDSFNFLPLPIPEECKNTQSSRTRGFRLDQCFETFLQEEHIGNHGQWYCEYCHKLTDAKKKLYLLKLPRVLIIQLKRFNYDLRSYTKIDKPIEYDLDNLDINEYVIESHRDRSIRYNLIAVSNHWGDLISGHYVTYAKHPGTQDWYRYNDARVGKMDKSIHMNNCSAYILVYQQEEKDSTIGTAV